VFYAKVKTLAHVIGLKFNLVYKINYFIFAELIIKTEML